MSELPLDPYMQDSQGAPERIQRPRATGKTPGSQHSPVLLKELCPPVCESRIRDQRNSGGICLPTWLETLPKARTPRQPVDISASVSSGCASMPTRCPMAPARATCVDVGGDQSPRPSLAASPHRMQQKASGRQQEIPSSGLRHTQRASSTPLPPQNAPQPIWGL